jgi:hypothetical protein
LPVNFITSRKTVDTNLDRDDSAFMSRHCIDYINRDIVVVGEACSAAGEVEVGLSDQVEDASFVAVALVAVGHNHQSLVPADILPMKAAVAQAAFAADILPMKAVVAQAAFADS